MQAQESAPLPYRRDRDAILESLSSDGERGLTTAIAQQRL